MDSSNTVVGKTGIAETALHGGPGRKLLARTLHTNWSFLIVLIAALIVIAPVWQPGYPTGTDAWGHLQRVGFLGKSIRAWGLGEGIRQSNWLPAWYMGDPTYVYYPPLITWILGLLTALLGDVFFAYRVFVTVLFLALAFSIYAIGVMWGRNRFMAILGTLLAITSPYTVRTVFVEGNLSRALAVLILPWLIWYTEQLLTGRKAHVLFIVAAALWADVLLAHGMQAAMFAVGIAAYVVFRIVSNIFVPIRRSVLVILPIVFGLGVAAMYLLPAYSQTELSNVPYLPPDKVSGFVITLDALAPYSPNTEAISVGSAAVILAAILTFRTGRDHQVTLVAAGITCLVLAFGPASGIYQLIPFNQAFLPERFLNLTAILIPLAVATAPRGLKRRYVWVIGCAIVLIVDGLPALRAVAMRPVPVDEQHIAQALAQESLPGRVAAITFPVQTASLIYLASEVGHKNNVLGWALENTPNQDGVRRLLSAAKSVPDYLQRVLSLWNTDYMVARFEDDSQAAKVQTQLGFETATQSNGLELWRSKTPSAFAQTLPDNRMLVIGSNATDWLFTFPFASEGSSPDPSQYDSGYLAHFSVIGLNRLPDTANIEASLGSWVSQGHTLIVDLSGMGQLYHRGYSLFGVQAMSFSFKGPHDITWPAQLGASLPDRLDFTLGNSPWVGATYLELPHQVASLTDQGVKYPLLGYKDVGKGRVWFVGFNLFYLLNQLGEQDAARHLVDYMLEGTGVDRSLALPPFDAQVLDNQPNHLTLSYTAERASSVVLSMTYFPRWQATLDGAPITLHDHEHLMLVDLPAGTHTLSLDYDALGTPTVRLGWLITAMFIGYTALAAFLLRRFSPLSFPERSDQFEDRVPQVLPTQSVDPTLYVPCPNCGFRLARTGPPNNLSFPFRTMDCPICGFAITDSLVPGESLSDYTRRRLAMQWLRKENLSRGQLLQHYGLAVEALFEDQTAFATAIKPAFGGETAATPGVAQTPGGAHLANCVTFSPAGNVIASGGQDLTIRLWETGSGTTLRSLAGHTDWITALAFSPDGSLLASGGRDMTVRLWSVESGEELAVLRGHLEYITHIAFNPTGTFVASCGQDRTVRLWSTRTHAQVEVLRGHTDWVNCSAFSADGKLIVSCGADRTIRVWQTDGGGVVNTLADSSGNVLGVIFNQESTALASITTNGTVCWWEIPSGNALAVIPGDGAWVKSAAFSPDAEMLATVENRYIHIRRAQTSEELATLKEQNTVFEHVTFDPDGMMLASIDDKGNIQLWTIR